MKRLSIILFVTVLLCACTPKGNVEQIAAITEDVTVAPPLVNGDFEADWSEEESHTAHIFPVGGTSYFAEIGNIFTPPGWITWFIHDAGTWDQPEVTDAWKYVDPNRVHSGDKAIRFFTFYRNHDGGFYQQVPVEPGAKLRFTVYAHAWSNTPIEGYDWCTGNGECSCGVGFEDAFILEGDAPPLNGDPWNDAIGNFTFYVGIDPTGGTDPTSGNVVWGQGAHIYNAHQLVPAAEVEAQGSIVTVFLRSRTLWAFKHNDAYWDDAELVVIGQEIYLPLVMKE